MKKHAPIRWFLEQPPTHHIGSLVPSLLNISACPGTHEHNHVLPLPSTYSRNSTAPVTVAATNPSRVLDEIAQLDRVCKRVDLVRLGTRHNSLLLPTYPKSLFPLPSALRDSNLEPSVPGGITR